MDIKHKNNKWSVAGECRAFISHDSFCGGAAEGKKERGSMGGRISHHKKVDIEGGKLKELQWKEGIEFPGSDFHASDHKQWMLTSSLKSAKLR